MWYKNGNNVGVRRKFGGREQCFSFGGKRCGLTKDALWDFAYVVLQKLDDGETEDAVKAWVSAAVRRDG